MTQTNSMMSAIRPSLAALAAILATPTLHAAGLAAIKEQDFHADNAARIIIYTEKLDSGAPFVKFKVASKTITYDRPKITATVDVLDSIPDEITEEKHIQPLRAKLEEMTTFSTRFPQSAAALEKPITSLTAHIEKFDTQHVRYHAKWITRTEFAALAENMEAETEKLKERERQHVAERDKKRAEREAFAAEQRAKGLDEYNGQWIPREEAIQRRENDRVLLAARDLVDAKSITKGVYGVYQVTEDGMLIRVLRGKMKQGGISSTIVFLTGANTGVAADGDLYKGDLYWTGNYSYNSVEGFVRTVNAYTLDRETAIRTVRATLSNNAPEPPPLAKNQTNKNPDTHPALVGASASGSGFFVGMQGHFITNAHVVDKATTIDILHQGKTHRANVVQNNPQLDLALLKIETPVRGIEITTQNTLTGQDVFAIGYPQPMIQGVEIKLTKGIISSQKGLRDDNNHYQIDAAVQPGNSGGPLCDPRGRLVGVVVARLDGNNSQNVNYAIKANVLTTFLRPHGIRSGTPDPDGSAGPNDGTLQAAAEASGLVIIR